jgi:putative ABC transport system substrate-binding protein
VVDPVADGVVADLQQPGGNITGTTSFDPLQAKKQLELMKEAIPGLKRVALLVLPGHFLDGDRHA